MTSASQVRKAAPEDKTEIWRLFRDLHQENGLNPLSESKVDYHIDRLLDDRNIVANDNGPRGIIGCIGPVGALEACIMLAFGTQWYSDEITLDEYVNYVSPEHRASNHAKELISFAKLMVDRLRPNHPRLKLLIGVLSTVRTAAKVRLYERQLTPSGCFFIYPAPEQVSPPKNLYRLKGLNSGVQ